MGTPAPAMTLKEEQQLFERLNNDPSVIGEIYDLYANLLYGYLFKRCAHKETAEDLVSHVFTKLLESSGTLEWRGVRIKSWLFTVATNALTDHFRKAGKQMTTDDEAEAERIPADDDPSWNAEISIESTEIIEIMQTLSERDQQALDLRFFGGLEPQEIGQTMDISPNHASVLVYRAIGRLRKKVLDNRSQQPAASS